MELKVKEKIIEQTVFVTNDGTEFMDEGDAEAWESKLVFDAEIRPKMYEYDECGYYMVESQNAFNVLKTYVSEQLDYYFNYEFSEEDIKFPIVIKLDTDGSVTIIGEEDYQHYKKICEMYEKINNQLIEKCDN